MNKGLIYRVLGALSSALIIISVFVPFIKVTGYSQSLWQSNQIIGTLYLPILIIAFGLLGVIFFALNIKTEFAYATSGAILFFVLMRTMDVISQNAFNTLAIGYYFLAIGAVFTGVMAFLCNMKKDNLNMQTMSQELNIGNKPILNNQTNLSDSNLNQGFQPLTNNMIPDINQIVQPNINSIDNQVVEPISSNNQIFSQPIPELNTVELQPQPIPELNTIDLQPQPIPEIQNNQVQFDIPNMAQNNVNNNENGLSDQIDPVVQQFINQNTNILQQGFENQSMNPQVSNFANNNVNVSQPFSQLNTNLDMSLNNINEQSVANPVIQEFTNNITSTQQNNSGNNVETDIFGQPINKK